MYSFLKIKSPRPLVFLIVLWEPSSASILSGTGSDRKEGNIDVLYLETYINVDLSLAP